MELMFIMFIIMGGVGVVTSEKDSMTISKPQTRIIIQQRQTIYTEKVAKEWHE